VLWDRGTPYKLIAREPAFRHFSRHTIAKFVRGQNWPMRRRAPTERDERRLYATSVWLDARAVEAMDALRARRGWLNF
jgi:hypothetical protein